MKESDTPPTLKQIPTTTTTATAATVKKESSVVETITSLVFSKSRYKLWVLAALVLLALWSMFTGSVTLKWSTTSTTTTTTTTTININNNINLPSLDDLDILEVEEREKVVKRMWDVYTQSSSSKLPRFWQQAFEAAYDALTSDVSAVRDAAVSEIAKLSFAHPQS